MQTATKVKTPDAWWLFSLSYAICIMVSLAKLEAFYLPTASNTDGIICGLIGFVIAMCAYWAMYSLRDQ